MEEKVLVKTTKSCLFKTIITWFAITLVGTLSYAFILYPLLSKGQLIAPVILMRYSKFPGICFGGAAVTSVFSFVAMVLIQNPI